VTMSNETNPSLVMSQQEKVAMITQRRDCLSFQSPGPPSSCLAPANRVLFERGKPGRILH
jgi:hypothetical protein